MVAVARSNNDNFVKFECWPVALDGKKMERRGSRMSRRKVSNQISVEFPVFLTSTCLELFPSYWSWHSWSDKWSCSKHGIAHDDISSFQDSTLVPLTSGTLLPSSSLLSQRFEYSNRRDSTINTATSTFNRRHFPMDWSVKFIWFVLVLQKMPEKVDEMIFKWCCLREWVVRVSIGHSSSVRNSEREWQLLIRAVSRSAI